MLRGVCLLLTACIDPGPTPITKRVDPRARLEDHLIALRHYTSCKLPVSIVFCENSGFDIGPVRTLLANQSDIPEWECLQFDGNQEAWTRGKGVGEARIMEYAAEHSVLMKRDPDDIVLKISGRYVVTNFSQIVDHLRRTDADLVVNLQHGLRFARCDVFAARSTFFAPFAQKTIRSADEQSGYFIEHVLAEQVLRAIADGARWEPQYPAPRLRGYSGWGNTPLHSRATLKEMLLGRFRPYLLHRWLTQP